jgi:hypothetical protein
MRKSATAREQLPRETLPAIIGMNHKADRAGDALAAAEFQRVFLQARKQRYIVGVSTADASASIKREIAAHVSCLDFLHGFRAVIFQRPSHPLLH